MLLGMRTYRWGLVQTHQQLRFSYCAIKEMAAAARMAPSGVAVVENGAEDVDEDDEDIGGDSTKCERKKRKRPEVQVLSKDDVEQDDPEKKLKRDGHEEQCNDEDDS